MRTTALTGAALPVGIIILTVIALPAIQDQEDANGAGATVMGSGAGGTNVNGVGRTN